MTHSSTRFDELLASVAPATPKGADFLLDLRDLLLSRGHPGKCVKCFFGLLGDLRRPGALAPLRHWLEQNLEVTVTIEGEVVEALPVQLDRSGSLREFCERTIATVRHDRAYQAAQIDLGFRYKPTPAGP